MSFPPPLPNNHLFPPGFPQPGVPPLPRFQIPLGIPLPLGQLPMGVTLPAGVASISAPPVRNQNAAVIAAPPMLSMSGSLLYTQPNALAMRNQAEVNKKITTVFVGNITERASDMLVRQLLSKCGNVHNWKRIQGPDGKLQAFGFCDYSDPESAMRAIRLLHDFLIGDKKLVVRVDAKNQEKLNEYRKNLRSNESNSTNDLDEVLQEDDKIIKNQLMIVLKEHEIELNKEPDFKILKRFATTVTKDNKNENLSEMEMEDDKRSLIHREIDKFRDTYKKYDEEKEEEKRKKDEERSKKTEKKIENRSRSKDIEEKSKSRRSRERKTHRDRRSSSYEKDRSESPVDEEEMLLRRRRKDQAREKEASYRRRLRNWEDREKRKLKEYEREQQKEIQNKNEEELEKLKLKQFLQDYDDDRHDSKFYKGRSFSRRQLERRQEIEKDNYEIEQERKEIEELKQKLSHEGHPDPESEAKKRFNIETSQDMNDCIRNLLNETRNNMLNNDDDSLSSTSNSGVPLVKSFGFAGMKISSYQNIDNANISNGSKSHSVAGKNENLKKDLIQISQDLKRKRLTVSEVFNSHEDDDVNLQNKKRRPPPNALLEDNTDSNLSFNSQSRQSSHLSQEEKRKQIKNLIDKIPTSTNELFSYKLDWDLLDNNLMERRIRPWVSKKIRDYIGEEEETLLEFICKKLFSKNSAQSLLDDVAMVLDDEAQVFVVKLWRLLIYEIEAKKLGINSK